MTVPELFFAGLRTKEIHRATQRFVRGGGQKGWQMVEPVLNQNLSWSAFIGGYTGRGNRRQYSQGGFCRFFRAFCSLRTKICFFLLDLLLDTDKLLKQAG
jgi:hypothetical protein